MVPIRAVAAALATLAAAPAPGQEATPPNVLVILADDLGIGDLGCFHPESRIPTPRLDALAAEGMRFTDAHSPSAVCTPTRYALLTGRYAWRSRLKSGVLWGHDRLLIEPGRATIASRLAEAGYATAAFGKWHLGLGAFAPGGPNPPVAFDAPLDAGAHTVGFGTSRIIPASLDIPPYVWVANGTPEEPPSAVTLGSVRRWSGGGGFWRRGPVAPSFDFEDVLPATIRDAAAWLEARADDPERPFFCYVPLPAPHTPWLPTEPFQGSTPVGWYGDFVHQVDDGIGRILDALDRSGRAADTLVIVSSDNGSHWRPKDVADFEHDAHAGYRGMKADIHEAGHRVPLIVCWPGRVAPDSRSDALVGLVDMFRTATDAAGLDPRDHEAEDSVSLVPVLTGTADAVREHLVCHSLSGTFALRAGRWKLIEGLGSGGFTAPARVEPTPGGPAGQLYDLGSDPAETDDRWLTEPERVATMRATLARIRSGDG